MQSRLIIDKAGRIEIPKPLREEPHVEPGDTPELELVGEQFTLRRVCGAGPLTKERGVAVFYAGKPLPASAIDDVREPITVEFDAASPRVLCGPSAAEQNCTKSVIFPRQETTP